MRIPEPLFKIINLIVRLLLSSPIHGFWSRSLLVIEHRGRKTGRFYRIPVRYVEHESKLWCFTSRSTNWWRNLVANPGAALLLRGKRVDYVAEVVTDDRVRIAAALNRRLSQYPQDAVYHEIATGADGKPDPVSVQAALPTVVLIEMTPKIAN